MPQRAVVAPDAGKIERCPGDIALYRLDGHVLDKNAKGPGIAVVAGLDGRGRISNPEAKDGGVLSPDRGWQADFLCMRARAGFAPSHGPEPAPAGRHLDNVRRRGAMRKRHTTQGEAGRARALRRIESARYQPAFSPAARWLGRRPALQV